MAALSTFEPGRRLRPEELTPRHLAAVGSTLAHLHAALGRHPGPMASPKVPPRPEVVNARLKELEGLVHGRPFSPEVDELVLRVLEAKRDALARWPLAPDMYQGAAWQFLHRDYRLENLLFDEGGQVTAILDFDFAREGYRAWEVMRAAMTATWLGSGAAGEHGMGLERATPLMEAYLERQPIPRPELQNLGHLWLDYLVRTLWPMSVPYENPGAYQPGLAAILADRDSYTRWLSRNLPEVEAWLVGLLH
ncbi:MAG: phosphotransferase [Firmicutes bacterium]|nr:phosphotransferase [Bacillota bacterium]